MKRITLLVGGLVVWGGILPPQVHAQGVTVQDTRSWLQRAAEWASHLAYLKNQLQNEIGMLHSISGRGVLGDLAPLGLSQIKSVLPPEWGDVYNEGGKLASAAESVMSGMGTSGGPMSKLDKVAYSLHQMQYQSAYDHEIVKQAYNQSYQEINDLQTLVGHINNTTTQKEAVDLQNRIQAQDVAVQNLSTRMQMIKMLQDVQERLNQTQYQNAVDDAAFSTDGYSSFDVTREME
jgi:hypothetical protein